MFGTSKSTTIVGNYLLRNVSINLKGFSGVFDWLYRIKAQNFNNIKLDVFLHKSTIPYKTRTISIKTPPEYTKILTISKRKSEY